MSIPDAILQARKLQVALDELSDPANKGIYYLSFATDEGFQGGVFIEAHGIITALDKANDLGIAPEGEVMCWGPIAPPEEQWLNRLLTEEEVESCQPQDPSINDIADEQKARAEDSIDCGATNPDVDYGRPCIRFQGHDRYDGQRNHVTESGAWW